jgi:molecular chaperone DnaJ
MAKRFYETLASPKRRRHELKSAFRKAAMQCHPDRHPGDKQAETRFKELNEAYQHLSDAQKRAAYDRYGHAAFDQSGMSDGFAASMSDIFDDLFGDMMGGGRRGRQSSGRERGADLRYNLEITLEEAFHGTAAIGCRLQSRAKPAQAPGRAQARGLRPARLAAGTGACARNRASSPSSARAPPVMAAGRRSKTLATNAPAPAA